MKITKFEHSCLLVEMPAPVNRTALFDPGEYSTYQVEALEFLDDVIITHGHADHFVIDNIKALVAKFPQLRITAPPEVVNQLKDQGIAASSEESDGLVFFDSPHEIIRPFYPYDPPGEIGVHYLDALTHPGDSHSFTETKAILALPVQAPWGSPNNAVKLGLELKPKYILPIHDWHWRQEAKRGNYAQLEQVFKEQGITFLPLQNGVPVVIDL